MIFSEKGMRMFSAVLFLLFGMFFAGKNASAADCSQAWCVSGDTSMFGNADLASTGSKACIGATYAPECNNICNNNGAGSNSGENFACKPLSSTSATDTVTRTTGGSCDSFNCYAPGQCPSGTAPSSSCGGTCPPPGGLGQLTTYCAPVSSNSGSYNGFSGTGVGGCEAGFVKQAGVCFPTDTGLADPEGGIGTILVNFLSWLLMIFTFLAIAAFIISGMQYLLASSDEDMAKTAKRNMKWAVTGVIVGFSGWIILQAVNSALTATNPFF